MKENPRKVKLIIFSAVVAVVLLLVCSVAQIVSINKKRQLVSQQQSEISRLKSELAYYQNQNSSNADNKDSDIEFEVG